MKKTLVLFLLAAISHIMYAQNMEIQKLGGLMQMIDYYYVDTVNKSKLVDDGIRAILKDCDPHSQYIPANELKEMNEPLVGKFEGVGIQFNILDDTIMVTQTIAGGPSEKLGIRPGDRIVNIDGNKVAGIKITNKDVISKLRGDKGTKVKVDIYRRGEPELVTFEITRDKIPLFSVDASYKIEPDIGYIKISRFADNTVEEFKEALAKLKSQGIKNLILDLSSNGGGYLNRAHQLADEFLSDGKLIVYTQGRSQPREDYYSTATGGWEKGKLVVMINEYSASASEIVTGAVQDWDRGLVVGRRSFGKGLVQKPYSFPDGSAVRLTVARYYTPSGRCIQKSYQEGDELYSEDISNRFKHGELYHADSIKFNDSLKYFTNDKRVVYGGGGIMPDVFIPIDTTDDNEFTRAVFGLGLVSQFCYDYVDRHRPELSVYKTAKQFDEHFQPEVKIKSDFIAYAIKDGAKPDEKLINASQKLITTQLKATLARLLFGNDGFYPVLLKNDKTFLRAVEDAKK